MRRVIVFVEIMIALAVIGCGSAAPPTPAPKSVTTTVAKQASGPPTPTPFGPIYISRLNYRDNVDVRELYKEISSYVGKYLQYEGTVLTIQADQSGTFIQLTVPYLDMSGSDVVDFIFAPNISTQGILEESKIDAWARPIKMYTITNAYGGQVAQPLLYGDGLAIPNG